jgi:hypothetical protein
MTVDKASVQDAGREALAYRDGADPALLLETH